MIKGINKRIVEVKLPESIYFEKAVVFLRSELPFDPELSAKAAENIMSIEKSFIPPVISLKTKARVIAGRILSVIFRFSVIICAILAARMFLQ